DVRADGRESDEGDRAHQETAHRHDRYDRGNTNTSSTAPPRDCSRHARANKFMAFQTQTRHQVDSLALDVSAHSAPSSTSPSTALQHCSPRSARANEFTAFKTPSLPSDTPTVRPPMNSLARTRPDGLALPGLAPLSLSSTSPSTAPPRGGPRPARANKFTAFKTQTHH
ncbi:hypothetical protein T492DRAFT_998106, partial [Pavlovales sp. CCMP2436]